jgi:hypothetical protein
MRWPSRPRALRSGTLGNPRLIRLPSELTF